MGKQQNKNPKKNPQENNATKHNKLCSIYHYKRCVYVVVKVLKYKAYRTGREIGICVICAGDNRYFHIP